MHYISLIIYFINNSLYFITLYIINTLLPSSWELLFLAADHEVDLLLRYRFTVEIKASLVSYLFPASFFFQFWKQITGGGGGALVCTEGATIAMKVLISSIVDKAV